MTNPKISLILRCIERGRYDKFDAEEAYNAAKELGVELEHFKSIVMDKNLEVMYDPRNKKIQELEADIVKIKDILYYEKALTLLYWQRAEEGEKRSWEELLEEERTFRLEYAKKLLKNEHEEVDW